MDVSDRSNLEIPDLSTFLIAFLFVHYADFVIMKGGNTGKSNASRARLALATVGDADIAAYAFLIAAASTGVLFKVDSARFGKCNVAHLST